MSKAEIPLARLPAIPAWLSQYLPEFFRHAPPPSTASPPTAASLPAPPSFPALPPVPEPTMWERFMPIMATLGFLFVFAILWSRFGLSLRGMYNRLKSPLQKAETQSLLVLLRRKLTSAFEDERRALRKGTNTTMADGVPLTSPASGITSPAMITVMHPDTMLQEFYGFKAVLEAQKASMKLDQKELEMTLKADIAASKGQKGSAAGKLQSEVDKKLPNAGIIVERLLSGIPSARHSIPLWMPATKADDGYYLTSLTLPSAMLNMMIVRQAALPAPFLQAARLGMSYHNICKYRESRAGEVQVETNRDGHASHNSNDRYDRALQDLWSVALCPEPFSRIGLQWQNLGFSTDDPIADLHDGHLYALDDLTFFARTCPTAHREMLQYMASKNGNRYALSGLVDTFSEATASFFLSVMLTRMPKAFKGLEEENWLDQGNMAADEGSAEDEAIAEGGGEIASPDVFDETVADGMKPSKLGSGKDLSAAAKDKPLLASAMTSYAPRNRDGSCLRFTPTMVRFLYGGAAAVNMFGTEDKALKNMPREKLSTKPTSDDERTMRHRLRQLHSCLLRAYFDLWKRDEPLSRELFLVNTFYAESGRIADEYLRGIMS